LNQQEEARYKLKNSISNSSLYQERMLKAAVHISDTAGFVGLGRIVNKKKSTGFVPAARGVLFKDHDDRLLHN
jgi:hypothetical protein